MQTLHTKVLQQVEKTFRQNILSFYVAFNWTQHLHNQLVFTRNETLSMEITPFRYVQRVITYGAESAREKVHLWKENEGIRAEVTKERETYIQDSEFHCIPRRRADNDKSPRNIDC